MSLLFINLNKTTYEGITTKLENSMYQTQIAAPLTNAQELIKGTFHFRIWKEMEITNNQGSYLNSGLIFFIFFYDGYHFNLIMFKEKALDSFTNINHVGLRLPPLNTSTCHC